ncbi:MAG: 2-hydroxychromene-2-carboxylate isomerase [Acetobacteraceae bacterium]|nr:2-hydroxychromene-2-carboxylate isomerase [Acetobacteraceae bacterium]
MPTFGNCASARVVVLSIGQHSRSNIHIDLWNGTGAEMVTTNRDESESIIWHFDLISPFSYLALPAVEALARRHSVSFRPVLLGVLLTHWGNTGNAEIESKRLHTYRLCHFLAEQRRVHMRFPPRHPFLSLPAQRLISALGAEPDAVRAAFDFVWHEGRDPSDPGELAALCARLDVADYAALIETRNARSTLRAANDAAIAAGVFGVPTLLIGRELFWGLDAMPLAEAYLRDPDLFGRGEMARLKTLPVGVTRGVN